MKPEKMEDESAQNIASGAGPPCLRVSLFPDPSFPSAYNNDGHHRHRYLESILNASLTFCWNPRWCTYHRTLASSKSRIGVGLSTNLRGRSRSPSSVYLGDRCAPSLGLIHRHDPSGLELRLNRFSFMLYGGPLQGQAALMKYAYDCTQCRHHQLDSIKTQVRRPRLLCSLFLFFPCI
jgi:hypothetical protein